VTNSYTVTNVQATDSGSYSVLVSNAVESLISVGANLSIKVPISGLIPVTSRPEAGRVNMLTFIRFAAICRIP